MIVLMSFWDKLINIILLIFGIIGSIVPMILLVMGKLKGSKRPPW